MIYKTHIVSSLSLGLLPYSLGVLDINNIEEIPFLLVVGVIFSLLPDLDEPNSYISRRTPLIPQIIRLFTTHRAITHQLHFVIILSIFLVILTSFFSNLYIYLPIAILSYIGHLLGDSCTISGIRRFFYPISKKTFWLLPKSLRFKTNSYIEHYFLIPLFSIIVTYQLFVILAKFPYLGI